jgi:protein-S-isoprenylcysteine O-methyltransferase Ste14
MIRIAYASFAYLGLMTLPAIFITGFRHDAAAPAANLWFNLAIYAAYITVHYVMTVPAFKRAAFGSPEGSSGERRLYVTISILTLLAVYALHQPVPGFAFESPPWLRFIGLCGVLLGVVAFFEFATFEGLGSLLGLPGKPLSHSVGAETPLMREGPYASVRHPMYRAAALYTLASLLIHPNAGQLLFAAMVSASFLGFIPVEERQLLRHRGEAYREYQRATPYRVLRGIL